LLSLRDAEFPAIFYFLFEDYSNEALLEENEEVKEACRSKGKEASPVQEKHRVLYFDRSFLLSILKLFLSDHRLVIQRIRQEDKGDKTDYSQHAGESHIAKQVAPRGIHPASDHRSNHKANASCCFRIAQYFLSSLRENRREHRVGSGLHKLVSCSLDESAY